MNISHLQFLSTQAVRLVANVSYLQLYVEPGHEKGNEKLMLWEFLVVEAPSADYVTIQEKNGLHAIRFKLDEILGNGENLRHVLLSTPENQMFAGSFFAKPEGLAFFSKHMLRLSEDELETRLMVLREARKPTAVFDEPQFAFGRPKRRRAEPPAKPDLAA
jgi:hypothetical protein